MRARNIKPGFFRNEDLVEVGPWARLLFIGLWMLADREGRLDDRPRRIKLEIFPVDDVDIEAELNDLARWNFITRYDVDGDSYIQIVNFHKHQRPHSNEAESTIPPVPSDHEGLETKAESTSHHGDKSGEPRPAALRPDSLNDDSLNDESSIACADASANGAKEPKKSKRQRKPDPYWDQMVATLGYEPETKSERGRWNKAISELREIKADPAEIPQRADHYRRRWPEMDLTPTALSSNWAKLRSPPRIATVGRKYEDVTGSARDGPEKSS